MNALYLCMNEYLVHFRENQWSNMWYLDVCHLTAELCEKVHSSYRQGLCACPATNCTQIASFPLNLPIFSHISHHFLFCSWEPWAQVLSMPKNNKNSCPCLLHVSTAYSKVIRLTLSAIATFGQILYLHCNPLTHKIAMWHKKDHYMLNSWSIFIKQHNSLGQSFESMKSYPLGMVKPSKQWQ